MTLPIPTSEAQYGYVVGRVIRAIADSMDADDKPDIQAATGSVTFLPKARLGRTSDYSAFVVREPIICPLDGQGFLASQIGQRVALTVGVYEVSFQLGTPAAIQSFSVEVTAAHTQEAPLDLVTAAPYSPPSGTEVQTMLVPAGAAVGQVLSWTKTGLGWVDAATGDGGTVDLSEYVKRSELPSAPPLDGYVTTEALASALAPYAKTEELPQPVDIEPLTQRVAALEASPAFVVVASEEEAETLPEGTIYLIAQTAPLPTVVWHTFGRQDKVSQVQVAPEGMQAGDKLLLVAAAWKSASRFTLPDQWVPLVGEHLDGGLGGAQAGTFQVLGAYTGDTGAAGEPVTLNMPADTAWAALLIRGASTITAGEVKSRNQAPAETTTTTAKSVDATGRGLAISVGSERTSAMETSEQVTLAGDGWTELGRSLTEGFSENYQTLVVATKPVEKVGATGDVTVTWPNVQANNGLGFQVIAYV